MMAKGTDGWILLASNDLEGTFARLQAGDAEVAQEPTEQPYGVRDCAVRDPAGNLIRIRGVRDRQRTRSRERRRRSKACPATWVGGCSTRPRTPSPRVSRWWLWWPLESRSQLRFSRRSCFGGRARALLTSSQLMGQ
jgi:hypothetical protein